MERSLRLKITGMSCTMCSAAVEQALKNADGVKSAYVNFATQTAFLVYDEDVIDNQDIIKIIKDAGYGAADDFSSADKELGVLKASLIISIVLSIPMLIGFILLLIPNGISWITIFHNEWVQLALATPVQFIIGYRFYRGAFRAIKSGKANVDALVMLTTTAAFGYSVYNMVVGQTEFYFLSSNIIITLVLLGRYLETKARAKASLAVSSLLNLQPKTATLVVDDNTQEISVSELKEGDVVLIGPGESIPSDGVVVEGNSQIDEAMITGESMSVFKKEGDALIGGTINKFGSFKGKITKIGKDTILYKIIDLVEEAQGSKAPIQRLSNDIAKIFVPSIVVIAIITFIITFFATPNISIGILRAILVLVIACPCALGLAAPLAILFGTGISEEKGVLIKDGESLENICKTNTVVFDKTGTVTVGQPSVTDVIPVSEVEFSELVEILGIAEKPSKHALGKAIYDYARNRFFKLPDPQEFEAISGMGVRAIAKGAEVIIGTRRMMYKYDIDTTPHESNIIGLERLGKIAIIMAVDNEVVAIIGVSDTIKIDSKTAIEKLKSMGLSVYMLTGDNEYTAEAIAAEAGIDKENVVFGVLPQDKSLEVKKLKEQGKFVMMVGDGINDAPCIAEANIGVAMGNGTDVAVETADIILTNNSLESVVTAIKVSKATQKTIKQNLFWAFIYNIIGIAFAATGVLTPVIVAAAMALSSVSVLLNSLALGRIKRKI